MKREEGGTQNRAMAEQHKTNRTVTHGWRECDGARACRPGLHRRQRAPHCCGAGGVVARATQRHRDSPRSCVCGALAASLAAAASSVEQLVMPGEAAGVGHHVRPSSAEEPLLPRLVEHRCPDAPLHGHGAKTQVRHRVHVSLDRRQAERPRPARCATPCCRDDLRRPPAEVERAPSAWQRVAGHHARQVSPRERICCQPAEDALVAAGERAEAAGALNSEAAAPAYDVVQRVVQHAL